MRAAIVPLDRIALASAGGEPRPDHLPGGPVVQQHGPRRRLGRRLQPNVVDTQRRLARILQRHHHPRRRPARLGLGRNHRQRKGQRVAAGLNVGVYRNTEIGADDLDPNRMRHGLKGYRVDPEPLRRGQLLGADGEADGRCRADQAGLGTLGDIRGTLDAGQHHARASGAPYGLDLCQVLEPLDEHGAGAERGRCGQKASQNRQPRQAWPPCLRSDEHGR